MPGISADARRGVPYRSWETIAFYAAMAVAALFPVLTVSFPPLADLPNHLARAHIMANLATDADLQRHYAVQWQLLSFQSSDLILPALTKLVGLETACRIFLAATFAMLLGGTAALHKTLFGRVGLWPAVAFLLLYNFLFAWGFVSFLFSSGLALILLAAWIRTAARESALRSAGFALAALLLFFCHFFAFAFFALAVSAFELGRWRQDRRHFVRRAILAGVVFVVPVLLFLLAARSQFEATSAYGGRDEKIRAILSPFNMYFGWQDFLLALVALGIAWVGFRERLFVLAAAMRWPLIAITVAAILMPNRMLSVGGVDFRLPTVLLLMLIGATDFRNPTRRQAAIFAGLFAVLMLVRVGTVTADWRGITADLSELRAAMATFDRGSRVVVVQTLYDHRDPPAPSLFHYRHLSAFAVIDRDVFLPHLFRTATPLRFISPGSTWTSDQLAVFRKPEYHPRSPAFAAADAKTIAEIEQVQDEIQKFEQAPSTIDWSDWPEQFDYLIDFDYGRPRNPVPALLTELHRGSYFSIFRIHAPEP